MRWIVSGVSFVLIALFLSAALTAQDLAPRAYLITPVHSNAVTMSYSHLSGDIIFGSSLPVSGASGTINVSAITFYHSLDLLGRSANVTITLPYTVADFTGEVSGTDTLAHRSGLMDLVVRFSVNIKGAPAMRLDEFRAWKQKTIIGASLKVIAPTGQYDPTKLINPGSNRWAFKPEIGISQRRGHWLLDGYGAVWFFTMNHDYFSRNQFSSQTNTLSQQPVGALEAHLSYDVKPRLWASIDANFWYGGRTSKNEIQTRPTLQANSRIGATCSVPLRKRHSMKVSYSHGARIRFGGNANNVSIGWQYSWLGKPN